MNIKETENAYGFDVVQGGDVICLSNAGGYIEIDREQLVELMATVKPWLECGEIRQ